MDPAGTTSPQLAPLNEPLNLFAEAAFRHKPIVDVLLFDDDTISLWFDDDPQTSIEVTVNRLVRGHADIKRL